MRERAKLLLREHFMQTRNRCQKREDVSQSWVAAPWLSSANLRPTRIECFKNFSAQRRTQVSSCLSKVLRRNVSTQSVKHLSTRLLYIRKLQYPPKRSIIIMVPVLTFKDVLKLQKLAQHIVYMEKTT